MLISTLTYAWSTELPTVLCHGSHRHAGSRSKHQILGEACYLSKYFAMLSHAGSISNTITAYTALQLHTVQKHHIFVADVDI